MSDAMCDRRWQIEASLDGRLDAATAASFERHRAGCAVCAAEHAALTQLAERMRSLPDGRLSELEQRRARNALLGAADARARGAERERSHRPLALALVAAAGLAAGALLLARHRGEPRMAAPVALEVRDEGAARFTREKAGDESRVVLRDGRAGFRVAAGGGRDRLVVALPDGRVEATEARFAVDVGGGRTRVVVVHEGSVTFEVAGYVGRLDAGDRWSLEAAEPDDAGPASSAPPSAVGGGSAAPTSGVRPMLPPRPAPGPDASTVPSAAVPPGPTAGARFAEAMAAFSSGDYARADELLAAFVRDFPRDGRSEDASYLRIEARSRRGDTAGAAQAARAYLAAFPRGLRRPEAERVVAATSSRRAQGKDGGEETAPTGGDAGAAPSP